MSKKIKHVSTAKMNEKRKMSDALVVLEASLAGYALMLKGHFLQKDEQFDTIDDLIRFEINDADKNNVYGFKNYADYMFNYRPELALMIVNESGFKDNEKPTLYKVYRLLGAIDMLQFLMQDDSVDFEFDDEVEEDD